jgi:hypothetical protein
LFNGRNIDGWEMAEQGSFMVADGALQGTGCFEVQIDETGAPDGADRHRTGALYDEANQAFTLQPALPVGQWNVHEIRVQARPTPSSSTAYR